jgi:hypothetical protein
LGILNVLSAITLGKEADMLKSIVAAALLGVAAFTAPALPTQAATVQRIDRGPAAVIPVRLHGGFHHFAGHHRFHGFRRGFVVAGPVYYYGYGYGYGGGCAWLRHRALVTGSPYWWHRYRLCRYGW